MPDIKLQNPKKPINVNGNLYPKENDLLQVLSAMMPVDTYNNFFKNKITVSDAPNQERDILGQTKTWGGDITLFPNRVAENDSSFVLGHELAHRMQQFIPFKQENNFYNGWLNSRGGESAKLVGQVSPTDWRIKDGNASAMSRMLNTILQNGYLPDSSSEQDKYLLANLLNFINRPR